MTNFDLHYFVSRVQICSSSVLQDTEILPARSLFFFLLLYILSHFLYML